MVNLLNYMDRWESQLGRVTPSIFARYTLSAVLDSFSEEMCPDAEDGDCSFTKQGLLQTALVIVYLAVSSKMNWEKIMDKELDV